MGTPASYEDPSEGVRDILTANYPGRLRIFVWILHPRDAFSYDGMIAALTGQPMEKTPWIAKVPQLFTTSIATTEGVGANE